MLFVCFLFSLFEKRNDHLKPWKLKKKLNLILLQIDMVWCGVSNRVNQSD